MKSLNSHGAEIDQESWSRMIEKIRVAAVNGTIAAAYAAVEMAWKDAGIPITQVDVELAALTRALAAAGIERHHIERRIGCAWDSQASRHFDSLRRILDRIQNGALVAEFFDLRPETKPDARRLVESGLPCRVVNALDELGVRTVEELDLLSDEELLSIPNFGEKTLEMIVAVRHGATAEEVSEMDRTRQMARKMAGQPKQKRGGR